MENAVVLREEITEAKIIEYLDAAGKTSSLLQSEKKMFLNIAQEFGLNPFKREIHITAYGQGDNRKCSIITGYEVYIKRAERTGQLDGWKMWTEGEGHNLKAVVEIYRKDQKYPFQHEVYYEECVQLNKEGKPNVVWAKQPRFMTKKVAIGQAFRLCFADDLGGMPYEETEVSQEEPRNVTEKTAPEKKETGKKKPQKQEEPAPQNNKIDDLRKKAWALIQKLPAEEQGVWIDSCKGANIGTFEEVIKDLNEYFNKQPKYDNEADLYTPEKGEIDIF